MQRPECTFGRRVSENDKKKTASEIESKRKKRGPHLAQNFTCQSTHCGVAKTGKQGGIFFVLGPYSVWDQDEVSFRILLFVFFFFFFILLHYQRQLPVLEPISQLAHQVKNSPYDKTEIDSR